MQVAVVRLRCKCAFKLILLKKYHIIRIAHQITQIRSMNNASEEKIKKRKKEKLKVKLKLKVKVKVNYIFDAVDTEDCAQSAQATIPFKCGYI